MKYLNSAFGSGGMFCTLSDSDLNDYVMHKATDTEGLRILQAVVTIGYQESDHGPPIYVLSPEVGKLL